MKNRAFFLTFILILLAFPTVGLAFGIGNDAILTAGTGLGGIFDEKFIEITKGIVKAMNVVLMIMTAVAALMLCWGMEEGKKLLWQTIFGIGAALNFGAFMANIGFWEIAAVPPAGETAVQYFELKLSTAGDFQILQQFLNNYINNVITPGANKILPFSLRMIIVMAIVQASWDLSFQFASGDKVQYLVTMVVKCGLWMYLMMNWIPLMNALASGFEHLGLLAGGSTEATMDPDKIVMNAIDIFTAQWQIISVGDLLTEPARILISIFALLVIVICMFFTSLELFMGKVEFYTIAIISIPLLPFGVTTKFSFLTDKVIGAMFNLSIKLALVSFLSTIATPLFGSLVKELAQVDGIISVGTSFTVLLQAVITALMVFLPTWKTPELVTSLLSGQPQLGGSMQQMLNKTLHTAGHVAGARAKTAANGGGVKGTLMELGKQKLNDSAFGRGYQRGYDYKKKLFNDNSSKKKE